MHPLLERVSAAPDLRRAALRAVAPRREVDDADTIAVRQVEQTADISVRGVPSSWSIPIDQLERALIDAGAIEPEQTPS